MGGKVTKRMMSDRFSRRDALKGLGGLLAGAAFPFGVAEAISLPGRPAAQNRTSASHKQPNILWITGEGVPLRVLSCYGGKLLGTPHIDRLANEGMRFENGFVSNALCAPSRATLLTGTYSHINGMEGNPEVKGRLGEAQPSFDEAQETFPKILKRNGYQTGMVGKWHLPANPGKVGFDYFVFKKGAGGPYYDPAGYLGNPHFGSTTIVPQRYVGYETDVITDLVIKGIKRFTQPFMMMVQFFNAHRPFDPPHKYEHIYDGVRIPEPGTFWDDYKKRAAPAREAQMRIEDMPDFHASASLTPRQRKQWNYQQFMAHFLGTMKAQDDNIGRLLDFLDKTGLAENTIVIYTADHGFFLGDHGWFDKRFMYEQAIRVPWIIRYPGQIKAGSVPTEWTVNIDNAPTVLDLAGLPIPARMQGKSLVPILQGNSPPDWRTSMYYHYYEFGQPHWVVPMYGIRTRRHKLIGYYTVNEWELFDLDNDPDEMDSLLSNRYQIPTEDAAIARNLADQLNALRQQYKDTTGVPVELWLDRD